MTTKENCDAILAELHKRYGGNKKRLEGRLISERRSGRHKTISGKNQG